MKPLCCALFIAFTLPLTASANDINGKWKAWFVGAKANRPRFVAEMVLDLKADGNRLTGMVHMRGWPGDAPISDGKVEDNHISFTAIAKEQWWSSGAGWRSSGYPKLKFTGVIRGNEVKLRVIWDNVLIFGTQKPDASEFEMEGKKIPETE